MFGQKSVISFKRDSTQPIGGNVEKLYRKNIKENEESQTRNNLRVVVGADENKKIYLNEGCCG